MEGRELPAPQLCRPSACSEPPNPSPELPAASGYAGDSYSLKNQLFTFISLKGRTAENKSEQIREGLILLLLTHPLNCLESQSQEPKPPPSSPTRASGTQRPSHPLLPPRTLGGKQTRLKAGHFNVGVSRHVCCPPCWAPTPAPEGSCRTFPTLTVNNPAAAGPQTVPLWTCRDTALSQARPGWPLPAAHG